jgi:transcriptional regulator with XRE-family HTH domain
MATPLADPGVARDSASNVGERVRTLREAKGLSLRELALRSGVSAPMLSQVERGQTSPTLAVAARIAAGLGLGLSALLRLDEGEYVTVVRASERRPAARSADGHRFWFLTPDLPGQRAQVSLHRLKSGGATGRPGDPPIHEPGSRETAVVESGRLVLAIDGRRYELAEGDAVTFDADLSHHFENPGSVEAVFLSAVSAGLRSS